ncbi:MAG: hypothetical protein IBX55_01685 [Methyloprofundus sp.]|nr:hypothetical protein [Methyloprofundus sp.]
MLNSDQKFHAFVKEKKEKHLWIDFRTKKEKWDFVQKHLPDVAEFVLLTNSKRDFEFSFLLVLEEWLKGLSDVQINY